MLARGLFLRHGGSRHRSVTFRVYAAGSCCLPSAVSFAEWAPPGPWMSLDESAGAPFDIHDERPLSELQAGRRQTLSRMVAPLPKFSLVNVYVRGPSLSTASAGRRARAAYETSAHQMSPMLTSEHCYVTRCKCYADVHVVANPPRELLSSKGC